MKTQLNQTVAEGRILSIDALRGFTMFWIISGGYIFRTLPDMFDSPVFKAFAGQLEHVEWNASFSKTFTSNYNPETMVVNRLNFREFILPNHP